MDIFIRIFIEIPLPVLHISGKKKVCRGDKKNVCTDFILIIACQTLRFYWVMSGSLMLFQNVCLLLI